MNMLAFAFLVLMPAVSGQYSCAEGYKNKVGTPNCAGPSGSSCSEASCCNLEWKLCAATDAITGNAKCKTGSDKNQFFDLKKGASTYNTDDNFIANCCSSCSGATCADWQPVVFGGSCGIKKMLSGTIAYPSSDCTIPAADKYKETCCVAKASCSAHTCSSGWTKKEAADSILCSANAATCSDALCCTGTVCAGTNAITGGAKCKTGSDKNQFFDLKKGATAYTDDDNFIANCCSSCSEATCADWQPVVFGGSCSTGRMISGTIAYPSSDCAIPAADKYKETCCVDNPVAPAKMKCADWTEDSDSEASASLPTGRVSPFVSTFATFAVLVGVHSF